MYLYFLCCLIDIHIFDYPDSWLSGLFPKVPPSPDNRGSTDHLFVIKSTKHWFESTQKFVLLKEQLSIDFPDCFSVPAASFFNKSKH